MLKSAYLVLLVIVASSHASLDTWQKLHAEKDHRALLSHLEGKYVANSDEEHVKALSQDIPSVKHHDVKQIADRVRFVKPNSMLTMDFVEDRLNIILDEGNKVEGVKYG